MSELLATPTELFFDFDAALELARKLKSPDAIQLVVDAELVADGMGSAGWDVEALQTFLTANGEMTTTRFSEAVAFLDAFAAEQIDDSEEEDIADSDLPETFFALEQTRTAEEPRAMATSHVKAVTVVDEPELKLPNANPLSNGGSSPTILPLIDAEELSWQERALCAQTDPEAFFPEKGGSTREAKRVCTKCEVRVECLEYAIDTDERFGIWGGLSERERRKLKKKSEAEEGVDIQLKDQKVKQPGKPVRPATTQERRDELTAIAAGLDATSDEFITCVEEFYSWRKSNLASAERIEIFYRRDAGESLASIASKYGISYVAVNKLYKNMCNKSTPEFIELLRNNAAHFEQSA